MNRKLTLTAILGIALVIPGSAMASRSMSTTGGEKRALDYSKIVQSRSTHQRCRSTECGPTTTSARTPVGEPPQAARVKESNRRTFWFRARCLATACPKM